AVAGALADAVDGALDLARAVLDGGQRVRHRQPEVVVTVDADDAARPQGLRHAADQGPVLLGDRVPDGVGDVHGAGARRHHRLGDLLEVPRLGTGAVL